MISKNGVALGVMLISFLGGNVSEADLATTLSTIGQLVSLGFMIINQMNRGDVYNFLFKKTEQDILK